jgi:hypothetical protein
VHEQPDFLKETPADIGRLRPGVRLVYDDADSSDCVCADPHSPVNRTLRELQLAA